MDAPGDKPGREQALEALEEIIDCLCRILLHPYFNIARDRTAPPPTLTVREFFRKRFEFHSDEFVYDELKEVRTRTPALFPPLLKAFQRFAEHRDLRSAREKEIVYMLAVLPVFLPKLAGVYALMKFSNRDFQWISYYSILGLEACLIGILLDAFLPSLAPAIFIWCIIAEFMERDLELTEALSSANVFALLTLVARTDDLLELCQERGFEFGKLVTVSERFVYEQCWDNDL